MKFVQICLSSSTPNEYDFTMRADITEHSQHLKHLESIICITLFNVALGFIRFSGRLCSRRRHLGGSIRESI